MRIIDAKGRIFGKVNIIDLLVIIFLISSLPIIYSKSQSRQQPTKSESIQFEIAAKIIKLSLDSANALSVGDKEYSQDGAVIAEIISLGKIKPYVRRVMLDPESGQDIYDPEFFERSAHIRLRTQINKDHCYYKGSLVRYNYPLYFIFNNKSYQALTVKEIKTGEVWIPVKVRFSGVSSEIIKMLKSNQYYEFDQYGKITAKLNKVINVKPSTSGTSGSRKERSVIKDIIIAGELLCVAKDGSLFYNNAPLKAGSKIKFTTNLLLTGEIIEIDI
jgi:hypothetical protein